MAEGVGGGVGEFRASFSLYFSGVWKDRHDWGVVCTAAIWQCCDPTLLDSKKDLGHDSPQAPAGHMVTCVRFLTCYTAHTSQGSTKAHAPQRDLPEREHIEQKTHTWIHS